MITQVREWSPDTPRIGEIQASARSVHQKVESSVQLPDDARGSLTACNGGKDDSSSGETPVTRIEVSADRFVAAPADELYSYIADYRNHHPHILPPTFKDLQVEEGGVGEGT